MAEFRPKEKVTLPQNYFPIEGKTRNDLKVALVQYESKYQDAILGILDKEFSLDQSSCMYESSMTRDEYEEAFLSYEALICIDTEKDEVIGGFYLKPCFPARGSHICTGGFIVKPELRNQGIGNFLTAKFMQLAKDMDFEMCYVDNVNMKDMAVFRLFISAKFECCGRIPDALKYKNEKGKVEKFETVMFYKDLKPIEKSVCMEWFY